MAGFWTGFATGAMNQINDEIAINRKNNDDMVKTAFRDFLENGLPRIQQEKKQYNDIVATGKLVRARYGDAAAEAAMSAKITDVSKAFDFVKNNVNLSAPASVTPNIQTAGNTPAPADVPSMGGSSGGSTVPDLTGVASGAAAPQSAPQTAQTGFASPAPAPAQQPPQAAPQAPQETRTTGDKVQDFWSVVTGKNSAEQSRQTALNQLASVPHASKEDIAMLKEGRSPLDALNKIGSNLSQVQWKSVDEGAELMFNMVMQNAGSFKNAEQLLAAGLEGKRTGNWSKFTAMPMSILTDEEKLNRQLDNQVKVAGMRQGGPANSTDELAARLLAITNRTPEQEKQLQDITKYKLDTRPKDGFFGETPTAYPPAPPQAQDFLRKNKDKPDFVAQFKAKYGEAQYQSALNSK